MIIRSHHSSEFIEPVDAIRNFRLLDAGDKHGMYLLMTDTLKIARELESASFERGQAEKLAEIIGQSHDDLGPPQQDVAELKSDTKLLKWMIGFNLAFSAAILFKLFG